MPQVRRMFARGLGIGVITVLAAVLIAAVALPRIVGAHTYTITGTSMEPALPLGTFIVTKPIAPERITVGDIVTFQLHPSNPTVATHRVVGISYTGAGERQFVTQGDNNNTPDGELLQAAQIVGKQWYSIPFLGWIAQSVSSQVRAWVVPIASGALIAYGVWMVIAGVRDRSIRAQRERDAQQAAAPRESTATDACQEPISGEPSSEESRGTKTSGLRRTEAPEREEFPR